MKAGKHHLKLASTAALAIASASAAWAGNAHEAAKTNATEARQVDTKGVKASTANMVLVGELIDTRDVRMKGLNDEKHRLLKVKPGNGSQAVVVDIGVQDPKTSFGLVKGDRVIAVGRSARINERPVLFAKSIGELYPVGHMGSVARDSDQMRQDESARAAPGGNALTLAPRDSSSAGGTMKTGNRSDSDSDPATSGKDTNGYESRSDASDRDARSSDRTQGTASSSTRSSTGSIATGAADVNPPDTRRVDEVIVWFDTDNLGSDRYGAYDEDFVWDTTDPAYSSWYPTGNSTAWNDNLETPHWDVWGYDDADELGLFDW